MIDAPNHLTWSKRDVMRWRSSSPENDDYPSIGSEATCDVSGSEAACITSSSEEGEHLQAKGRDSESAFSSELQSEPEPQASPSPPQQYLAASHVEDKHAVSISKPAVAQQYWYSPWDSPLLLPPVGDDETCGAGVALHVQGQGQKSSTSPAPDFEGQRHALLSSSIPSFENKGLVHGSSHVSNSQSHVQASAPSNMSQFQDPFPVQTQASLSSHPPKFDTFRWDSGSSHVPPCLEKGQASSQSCALHFQSQGQDSASSHAPHVRGQVDDSVSSHPLNLQVPALVSSSLNPLCTQDQRSGSASSHVVDLHLQKEDIESSDDDSDEGEILAAATVSEAQRALQEQQQQQQLSAQQEMNTEELARLRALVPLDGIGMPTSIGSIHHASGGCKACVFLKLPAGCSLGVDCHFCHLPHKNGRKKNKLRPCKGKRDRYRRLLMRLKQAVEDDPHGFNINAIELPPSIAASDTAVKQKLLITVQGYLDAALMERDEAGDQSGDANPASLIAPDFPPPTRLMNPSFSPPKTHHVPHAPSCVPMSAAGVLHPGTRHNFAGVDASHSMDVAARFLLPQGSHQHHWPAAQARGHSSYLMQPCLGYTGRQMQWVPPAPYQCGPCLPSAR